MPKEISSSEEFAKLLDQASEVRVVRLGDNAKVKLRTKDALYTFKTGTKEADSLLKSVKVPVEEY